MSIKIYDKAKIFGKTKVVVGSNEEIPTSSYSVVFGDGYTDEPITEANEGSYVSLTLLTLETDAPNGTEIPYTITGISEQDSSLPLNGVFVVGVDQQRRFTVAEDFLTEGPETMVITLDGITPTVSAALVINDTSTTPVPTYTPFFGDGNYVNLLTEANEGDYTVYVLQTTNVTQGTVIPYTITGISPSDINVPLQGSLVIEANREGYIFFTIADDLSTEGPETMVITLDGITPTVSAALVINDTSTE
jgi:hypothetical protein